MGASAQNLALAELPDEAFLVNLFVTLLKTFGVLTIPSHDAPPQEHFPHLAP